MAKAKEAPEQGYLPDMAPVKNEKIHRAARRYRSLMLARKEAMAEEVKAAENLMRIMKEEGMSHYEYGDLVANIDAKEKVSVKVTTESNGEKEDEE